MERDCVFSRFAEVDSDCCCLEETSLSRRRLDGCSNDVSSDFETVLSPVHSKSARYGSVEGLVTTHT